MWRRNAFISVQKEHLIILSPCPPHLMIMHVKKPDVEVLGWCGYTWSAVVRLVGRTAKFSKTTLEAAYGREINIK